MDKQSLMLYYVSMFVYIFGSITLILYTLIIKPISIMYHEPVNQMVSPIFGNYAKYLASLEIFSLIVITVSFVLFGLSMYLTYSRKKKVSMPTIIFPAALFIFAYVMLGVSGF